MSEQMKSTRRGFFVGASSLMGLFTIDEDGDGEYLDDLMGEDEETQSAGGAYLIRANRDAEFDKPAVERIEPERTPALLLDKDGAIYSWDDAEESWRWYSTTGPAPELEQITGAKSGAAVYDDATKTVGDGTTKADHAEVSAGRGDITGESVIQASRSSSLTGVSATTRVNIVDTEIEDNNNEFDESGNAQIVPNEDQLVAIDVQAEVLNATAGDRIDVRVYDVDAGAAVELGQSKRSVLSDTRGYFNGVLYADLTGGNAHEVQVTNFDSQFDLTGRSQFALFKQVVHQ